MRDYISWVNDEFSQLWPVLLVLAPLVARWRLKRADRKRAEMLTFVRAAIDDSTDKAAAVHAEDIGIIREQVANDHGSNLREDLDEIHGDIRTLLTGMIAQEQHYKWSQEWTERVGEQVDDLIEQAASHATRLSDHAARIAALEAAAANPTPPP